MTVFVARKLNADLHYESGMCSQGLSIQFCFQGISFMCCVLAYSNSASQCFNPLFAFFIPRREGCTCT